MSRPRSSVPIGCGQDGGCREAAPMAAGSEGASKDAKAATSSMAASAARPATAGRFLRKAYQNPSMSGPPYTRIENPIDDVGDEIGDHDADRDENEHSHEHRIVPGEDGIIGQPSETGPAEHDLDQDGARQE